MSVRRVVPDINSERVDESREFYVGVLGFKVAMDLGWVVTFASPTNPTAQITVMRSDGSTRPVPQVTVEVADVDAVHAEAVRRGADVVYPLTDERWGVRRFFLRDPNGVVINVMCHRVSSGPRELAQAVTYARMSGYMRSLRAKVGHDLLVVSASGTYVLDSDGRVLLIRHSEGGRWTNPGGIVEPFETPADAAVRETWEETGLFVELTRFVGVFGGRDHHITYSGGDEVNYLAFAFKARVVGGSLVPDGKESLEARYVTREEAFDLDLSPPTRRALRVVFDDVDRTYFDVPSWAPPAA